MSDWQQIHTHILELYSIKEAEGFSSQWHEKKEWVLSECYDVLTMLGQQLAHKKWTMLKDEQLLGDYVRQGVLLIMEVLEGRRRTNPPYDPIRKPIQSFLYDDFNRFIPLTISKELKPKDVQLDRPQDDMRPLRNDLVFIPEHLEENDNQREMTFAEVAACIPQVAQFAFKSWQQNKDTKELDGWEEEGQQRSEELRKFLASPALCYVKRAALAKGERGMLDQNMLRELSVSQYSCEVYDRRALWKNSVE